MNPKARRPAPDAAPAAGPAVAAPGEPTGVQEGSGPQQADPQDPDDSSPMSLTTVPEVPVGQGSWARALAVVVVAEATVLWLAASLGLWRRRLLPGRVGHGARNSRLRSAAALARWVPYLRSRLAGGAAAPGGRRRSRR
jgi:hypothetical protein